MDGHIIDVHAHLYPSSFPTTPIEQILIRAKSANVSSIVSVPETLEDAQNIFELKNDLTLSSSFRDMIEPCAGLHPAPQGAMSLVKVDQADSILQFIKDKSSDL
ncbi:13448_t:CDS:1, partial [Cetraspora pellucida]